LAGGAALQFPSRFVAAADGERVLLQGLGIEIRIVAPGAGTGGQLAMFEETTAPGMGPPLHVHHRQTEIFRFLEGDYEMAVGGRRYRATPGAAAIVPPGVPHAFRNVGATPARLLFLLAPALEAEAFFTALAAATMAGKPDPAVLAAFAQRFGTEIIGPPLGD
jgi:mannose-6-phosphate isomerase-like protein (cupin superfamily)